MQKLCLKIQIARRTDKSSHYNLPKMGDKNKDTARASGDVGTGWGKTTCSLQERPCKRCGASEEGDSWEYLPEKKIYLEHRKLSMNTQEGTGCTEHAAAELSNTGSEALLALVQGRRIGINKI